MISMSYSCRCGFKTSILNSAQEHANETFHHVDIRGFCTPNKLLKGQELKTDSPAEQQARQNAILRRARDKGLLK